MDEPPRRVNFFEGLLLSAADLAEEQAYHRQMRYLHNRLHGFGTVSGLEVAVSEDRVHVSPGLGIDVLGRELVVTTTLTMPLEPSSGTDEPWVRDVVLVWQEVPESPVARPDGTVVFARWVEQPEPGLVAEGTAAPEGLVLARLTRSGSGSVTVDTTVRRHLTPPHADSDERHRGHRPGGQHARHG